MDTICVMCQKEKSNITLDVAKGVTKRVCLDCFDEFLDSLTNTPINLPRQDPDDERKYGRY
jgi:hypothetical protein